jgi:hypothetical protein
MSFFACGDYSKILLAYYPSMLKYFWCILRACMLKYSPRIQRLLHVIQYKEPVNPSFPNLRLKGHENPENPPRCHVPLNTFDVFSMYDKLLLAYSPNTIKYFPVFKQKYAKTNKNTQKTFSLSTIADDFKGTVIPKNRMRKWTLIQDNQIPNYIFYLSFTKNLIARKRRIR